MNKTKKYLCLIIGQKQERISEIIVEVDKTDDKSQMAYDAMMKASSDLYDRYGLDMWKFRDVKIDPIELEDSLLC